MAHREQFYVCSDCGAFCDCSGSHLDVGQCTKCDAPIVRFHDLPGLKSWCGCRAWGRAPLAKSYQELMTVPAGITAPVRCPKCKGEMHLSRTKGSTELEGISSPRPIKPSPIKGLFTLMVLALLAYAVYYGW